MTVPGGGRRCVSEKSLRFHVRSNSICRGMSCWLSERQCTLPALVRLGRRTTASQSRRGLILSMSRPLLPACHGDAARRSMRPSPPASTTMASRSSRTAFVSHGTAFSTTTLTPAATAPASRAAATSSRSAKPLRTSGASKTT